MRAADDIHFDGTITPEDFAKFSRIVAQGIYCDPIQPARASGLLHFDIGIGATIVKVDENASYWKKSVPKDIIVSGGYVGVPRLIVAKGYGGGTISASYAKISDTGVKIYGGAMDVPLIRGSIATPEVSLRAVYSKVSGIDVYKLKSYGYEAFVSKGFGPLTPYVSVGRMTSDARGSVDSVNFTLKDKSTMNRYSAGVRISMLVPKLVIQATQAEQRSYSAKISFGW
ncbi:MAG TPA: hypothetical protein VJ901_04425 [Thermoanaerobaculia bacterium]|nr:hypothetical protein [Thermoanaerobaculia bacterium]